MFHTLNAKRIVIKVGTSTITHKTGKINLRQIDGIAKTLTDLMNSGKEVVLVTSGAGAVGRSKMKMTERPKEICVKQAVAAIGQCELMYIYDKAFSEFGQTTAQILLTKDIVDDAKSKENVINTFETLIKMGVIPIVNENDTVSYDEIEFGDNDSLSAVVATLIEADTLVLLSDVDGLYSKNPSEEGAKLIPVVYKIDDHIRGIAGGSSSAVGTGGMITKIHAGEIANNAGIDMLIANGENPSILYDIFDGKSVGTIFLAKEKTND